jgi:SPP1 gp7 family putative phage head morphogenesis protein
MTYEQAQIYTFTATEEEAKKLILEMSSNYKRATSDIIRELNIVYGKFLNNTDPANYYNLIIQQNRLESLLAQTQSYYRYYSDLSGKLQVANSELAITNTFYRNQYSLMFLDQSDKMIFSTIDPRIVELSVTGTQESWLAIGDKVRANVYQPGYGTLSSLLDKNAVADLAKINQTITQGFIQGWHMDEMGRAIEDIFGTTEYNALRIAQTEFTRCSNSGDYAATEEAVSQGVECQRMWVATLDTSTRDAHQELDGQIVGMDEPFEVDGESAMFPGDFGEPSLDINCRCTVVTLVDGQSPQLRRGRDPLTGENEVISYQKYDEYMASKGMMKNTDGIWKRA